MAILKPQWDVPDNIQAFYTNAQGGHNSTAFGGFNLAMHVGDNPEKVAANRVQLPHAKNIVWLNQVHSADCIEANSNLLCKAEPPRADAIFTHQVNLVCAVMTADCVPLLLCDKAGKTVAAIHAGWRGLAAGVIETTLDAMDIEPSQLQIWIGPHIRQAAFEVGKEVYSQFSRFEEAFEVLPGQQKYSCSLVNIVEKICRQKGVVDITDSRICSYSDEQFYSYRRSFHRKTLPTGRMVCGIFIN